MEDEEKIQWHDKLNDGRLEGGVVVYVVWREKGEKLGWWAPHESWRAVGFEVLFGLRIDKITRSRT